MRKISIFSLHAAAPMRRPGYVEAVRARGRAEGDVIVLSDADYDALRSQYQVSGVSAEAQGAQAKRRFELCRACAQSRDAGFGCAHHKGCCFGQWRSRPESKCPEGTW